MKKHNKKGFTIVELVIVIALIAILAAVLIPTFSNVINNAHESSDTMMVKNLNTILNSEETLGNGAKTMQEAIDQAEEGGYKVDKLTPTSTGDIVWDQESNRFLLINAKGAVVYRDESVTDDLDPKNAEVAYKLWKISHNAVSDAAKEIKYSLYLADTVTELPATVEVGIDVGINKNVAVNFASAAEREVVIRTNGGTLNVNAANATVRHFGEAEKVVIAAVAGNSYHEYGTVVGNIEVAKGRVVMETGSAASAIKVTATKEEVTNGAKVVVDTKTSNVAVVVPAEVKDEIIAKGGSITAADDKVVTDTTVIANMDKFAGGLGTAESPYLIATAEQFLNIGDFSDEMRSGKAYSFKLIADIDLREVDSEFKTFGKNNFVAVSGYFRGTMDGKKDGANNYKLIASDTLNYVFANSIGSSKFTNIDYYLANDCVWLCAGQSGRTDTLFDNVDMYMVDSSNSIPLERNEGLYTSWVAWDIFNDDWTYNNNVTIKNADVYVNIVGEEYNAVFFGATPYYGGSATVIDSTYYGEYFGDRVNLVLGNVSHYRDYTLTVTNVTNKGTLASTYGSPMIAGGNYTNTSKEDSHGAYTNVNLGKSRYLFDDKLAIANSDSGLKITEAASTSADYYVLTLSGGTRLTSPVSENSVYSFRVKISKDQFENKELQTAFKDGKMATVAQYKEFVDADATFDSKDAIKVYGETGAEFYMVEKDGTAYYVFDFHDDGTKHFVTKPNKVITSSVVDINSASITVYDEEGLPIAQKPINLK